MIWAHIPAGVRFGTDPSGLPWPSCGLLSWGDKDTNKILHLNLATSPAFADSRTNDKKIERLCLLIAALWLVLAQVWTLLTSSFRSQVLGEITGQQGPWCGPELKHKLVCCIRPDVHPGEIGSFVAVANFSFYRRGIVGRGILQQKLSLKFFSFI